MILSLYNCSLQINDTKISNWFDTVDVFCVTMWMQFTKSGHTQLPGNAFMITSTISVVLFSTVVRDFIFFYEMCSPYIYSFKNLINRSILCIRSPLMVYILRLDWGEWLKFYCSSCVGIWIINQDSNKGVVTEDTLEQCSNFWVSRFSWFKVSCFTTS